MRSLLPTSFLPSAALVRPQTQSRQAQASSKGEARGLASWHQRGALSLLLWLMIAAPAAAIELRVRVAENSSQLVVGSSTPARILDASRQPVGSLRPLEGFSARPEAGTISFAGRQARQLWIEPTDGGYVYIGNRWYRGRLQLIPTGAGVMAINHVNLEAYLASVVGKEMYPQWPAAALQAQAVAARSFALSRRQVQGRNGSLFDVGDTISHQVYTGLDGEFTTTQAAVKATRGQVLTFNGNIVEAVFHAASGGHTENSENVWTQAKPYLRGVPDYDAVFPNQQWTVSFTAEQMRQRLPGVGNVLSIQPLRSSPQGRLMAALVTGDAGTQTISGNQLRRALGLRSTLFQVNPQMGLVATAAPGATPTVPESFMFNGRGFGHGLGMSQWGALGMAQLGKSYREILQHYFQGTTITTLPSVE